MESRRREESLSRKVCWKLRNVTLQVSGFLIRRYVPIQAVLMIDSFDHCGDL